MFLKTERYVLGSVRKQRHIWSFPSSRRRLPSGWNCRDVIWNVAETKPHNQRYQNHRIRGNGSQSTSTYFGARSKWRCVCYREKRERARKRKKVVAGGKEKQCVSHTLDMKFSVLTHKWHIKTKIYYRAIPSPRWQSKKLVARQAVWSLVN